MANVKVLLNEKVETLGEIGEIVNVRAGYARNYLLPRKIASIPTVGELKRIEKKKKLLEEKYKEEVREANEIAKQLGESLEFEITAKAGEAGKLFGSITTKDIAELIKEKTGVELQRKQILLKRSITDLGEYKIKIKLHQELTIEINLIVKKED